MSYPSMMNVRPILEQLIEERDQIDEAILSLERLAAGRSRGRGRPPAWLKEAANAAIEKPKRRGRPPGKSKSKT